MTNPALHRVPQTFPSGPAGADATRPSNARTYDFCLGGKDNYEVDRVAVTQIVDLAPGFGDLAQVNRRWQHRVVRYLAGYAGIDQFLDIGSGLPTALNIHQVAQAENHDARVMYVDNDPLCVVHGNALLTPNDNIRYMHGDITEPGTLLENLEVTRHLDTDQPIAILACGVLQHLADDVDPARVIGEYIARMPAGSFLATSNFWDPADEDPELHALTARTEHAFVAGGLGATRFQTRQQQLRYFDGLQLVEPGLTELDDWWPLGPSTGPRSPQLRLALGGVGYKQPTPPPRIHPR